MRNPRLLSLLAILALMTFSARADIDKKLYEKAAKYVWGMDLPQFNPATPLTDSIFHDQSAVYIARYTGITADYDNGPNASKLSTTGINDSNASKAIYVERNMVKLNDASAIEKFSDFTINPPVKQDIKGYVVVSIKPAFGARIHKPDGSVKDVDMSEALTVTKGKKNKDSEYKIAIPGLEAGDILEYFKYSEMFCDEMSLPGMRVPVLASYPTHNFMLDCRVAEQLALEYGAYNGAPKSNIFEKIDGKNRLFIELEDIEGLNESTPYFSSARQMPFIEICLLNNSARLEFVPATARVGGIRHTNTAFLMSDIASAIRSTKPENQLVGDAAGTVKKWMKAHPDASSEDVARTAWLALRHAKYQNDISIPARRFAVSFYNLLDKIGSDAAHRIAVTSSRQKVPVKDLNHFTDATYMVIVNDLMFICSDNPLNLPGEILPEFDGEAYIAFNAPPSSGNIRMSTQDGRISTGNADDNTTTMEVNVRLNPEDDNQLLAENQIVLTGNAKLVGAELLSTPDMIADIESYLNLKPGKLPKTFDKDGEAEEIREAAEEFAGQLWSGDDISLDNFEVTSRGCTPDKPELSAEFVGKVNGAVSQAGNNLMVNLGRFICKQKQITGSDRKRRISIVRPFTIKYETTIRFEIPEGYELVEESLDDLRNSLSSPDAVFESEASSDGNTVTLHVIESYPKSISAPSAWRRILKVHDLAYDYNSASVVLRPKK